VLQEDLEPEQMDRQVINSSRSGNSEAVYHKRIACAGARSGRGDTLTVKCWLQWIDSVILKVNGRKL
jgi:hypothetical protein